MIKIFNQYIPKHKFLFFIFEISFILLSFILTAFYLWNNIYYNNTSYLVFSILPYACIYILCYITSFYYFGLYEYKLELKLLDYFYRICLAVLISGILFSAFHYFFPYFLPNIIVKRKLMVMISFISFLTGTLLRYLYYLLISSKKLTEKILILGGGEFAKETAKLILSNKEFKNKIVGFLDFNNLRIGESILNPAIIGVYEDVYAISKDYKVDRIIVALEDKRGKLPMEKLVDCKLYGITVEDAIHFYERLSGKLFLENLTLGNLIFCDGFCVSSATLKIKRLFDIIISCLMLFVTLPIIIIIYILIKIDSRGSCIFRQERIGENGKNFKIYKFRTMGVDAEDSCGPTWASKNDPRITKIGRLLRNSRLDEIPQLFNVLKGDMSFVGPRPERPYFVEQLKKVIPFYILRTSIKPGITGWAQIKFKYGDSVDDAKEKLQYDLFYIKNLSTTLDLSIIWQTVKVVLFGEGAQ